MFVGGLCLYPGVVMSTQRPSLEDLRKRLRENEEQAALLAGEHKRARRRESDRRAAAARAWNLSGSLLHTVLIMYSLADYVVDPAVVFLRQRARQRHWPERSEGEIGALVEDVFVAADAGELAALSDLDNPSDAPALATAVDYVEQWCVASWVKTRNRLGVAPPTRDVLGQFQDRQSAVPPAVRPRAWGASDEGSARMRLARWRQRWGGRVASLRPREILPQSLMLQKVCRGARFPCRKLPQAPWGAQGRGHCGGGGAAWKVSRG